MHMSQWLSTDLQDECSGCQWRQVPICQHEWKIPCFVIQCNCLIPLRLELSFHRHLKPCATSQKLLSGLFTYWRHSNLRGWPQTPQVMLLSPFLVVYNKKYLPVPFFPSSSRKLSVVCNMFWFLDLPFFDQRANKSIWVVRMRGVSPQLNEIIHFACWNPFMMALILVQGAVVEYQHILLDFLFWNDGNSDKQMAFFLGQICPWLL